MYVTVDDLRDFYSVRFADSNTGLVEKALASAEAICLRYIGLADGLSSEQAEFFDGTSSILSLGCAPILSMSAVYMDGSRAYDEALDSSYYRADLKTGTIFLYVTPVEARDAIKVVYTAGYESLPEDVAMSIAMTTQKILSDLQGSAVGVLSRTLEGGSETLDNNLPTLAVRQVLDAYRIKRAR